MESGSQIFGRKLVNPSSLKTSHFTPDNTARVGPTDILEMGKDV